ncbi:MAG: NAD(P)/FAD-dependent oxidoreductase [Henriciella sp.]|nr:NAD(P)/FAD-dependent oxidoreductase [Henriciella sp.]
MMDLATYTEVVRNDLDTIGLGASTWVRPRNGVYDVVIVGGGQSGMGAAFGLMRERVTNLLIVDENDKGDEGPWGTYARMITLRTPKHLTSIDLGVPSLTFRAYWVAQHGQDSWDAIDKIPREDWLDYLKWYRDVLDLPIENNTKLKRVEPEAKGLYRLHLKGRDGDREVLARKVVLATGIQGGGEWHTPDFIKQSLPKSRYAHTSEAIDYAGMKGKKIAILGNGASSFDNAQHALKLGVGSVDVFVRRKVIPSVNPIRFMEQTGLVPRFAAMDDASKYEIITSFIKRSQPPTNDTFTRSAAWPNFSLHLGAPWDSVRETEDGVEVVTPQGTFTFDFLVLSTGLVTDHALRPELASVSDKIALWKDRYQAPDEARLPLLDAHPYLGAGFEFLPKTAEDADALYGLYAFNYSALVNFGLSAAALTGLGYAIPKLANSIANQLFLDDQAEWMQDYLAYSEPEFVSDWTPERAEKVPAE